VTGLLRRLFGRANEADGGLDYARARELASHPDMGVRRRLAGRTDVQPEILYYLAADGAAEVRRAIASNDATPPHAYRALAEDADDDVRCDLAYKIARLTPQLSSDARDRIRELTLEALDILARDEIVRVRRVLAETLKDVAQAPHDVILRLARDTELEVAAPVLEFSPLLTDDDLLEIIASPTVAGALAAISRRALVSEAISDAIVHSEDWDAVASLLGNPSAQIREETLDQIVDGSRTVTDLQMPIVRRPRLPLRAARKLATFVADAVLTVLMRRTDLDEETAELVSQTVRKRMSERAAEDPGEGGAKSSPPAREPARIAEEVRRLDKEGKLDDGRIASELTGGNRVFVTEAIALKSGLPATVVERIAAARSAKAMTALAWKAGFSMRFAVKLQSRFGNVPSGELLHPRDGFDYPMSEEDMTWQIGFYAS
jgi:uncharacterized protein (DUF2336 family)